MNIGKYVIVSDFDGTITCEDSNDLLFRHYGNTGNEQIEKDFRAGILGTRTAMVKHFDIMHITLEEYSSFLDDNIQIDIGFDAFLQDIRQARVDFFIVSAGFRQAIVHLLGANRLRNIQIFANDLVGEVNLKPLFAQANPTCAETIGPCGNCKKACIEAIRRQTKRSIIYIGDGLTDRCAAYQADLLFAKNDLSIYCHSQGLPYIPFKTFSDIAQHLRTKYLAI